MDLHVKRHGYQPYRFGEIALFERYAAKIVPKFAPYKDEVDIIIARLHSAGIVEHLLYKFISPRY